MTGSNGQKGPDFMCIGAQKAGTTWLYNNIDTNHPDILLPPYKEIHYFDRNRIFAPLVADFATHNRTKMLKRMGNAYWDVVKTRQHFGWYNRYYFAPRSHDWYKTLFDLDPNRITGDITPKYACIEPERIAMVKETAPDCKLIYILRHPTQRIWSEVAMFFDSQGIQSEQVDEKKMWQFVKRDKVLRHSLYFKNLNNWLSFFPREQIHILYLEQISQEPEKVLLDIYNFLGLPERKIHFSDKVYKKAHARTFMSIPAEVKGYLAEQVLEDTRNLHKLLDTPYTEAWLRDIEASLE